MKGKGILTRELGLHFRPEHRKWNQFAAECRGTLEENVYPIVDTIIDGNPELAGLGELVNFLKDSVRWDLAHIVMEYIYSDLVPPRFYSLLLEVYQSGHFPCGWDEVWPDGTLWVY